MKLNDWIFHDLEKEMRDKSVLGLLKLFKSEDKKYKNKCSEYFLSSEKSKEERNKLEKECEFLEISKLKVALRIAELMSD